MAWACVALIVYASLHPFSDWAWPAGGWRALWLPWPHYIGAFDVMANVLGYLPLGFFIAAARFSRQRPRMAALGVTVWRAALLSYAMELLQQALPVRVPSLLDWALNVSGAAAGAVLAGLAVGLGLGQRWHRLRHRWRVVDDGVALTLLLLWPVALLFPATVPFGLGQVMLRVREWAAEGLEGTQFEGWVGVVDGALVPALPPGPELLATALGLAAPCLVAFTVVRQPLYRAVLALGVGAVGTAATSLSTALNFSPEHAMTWISRSTLPGMQVAALLALAMLWLRPRVVAALGLVLVTAGLFLVNMAPVDPYVSSSLQGWEQGRFIRFHGVAQWMGWIWPFAVLGQLLRTVFRETESAVPGATDRRP
jgi:VanZ family protein